MPRRWHRTEGRDRPAARKGTSPTTHPRRRPARRPRGTPEARSRRARPPRLRTVAPSHHVDAEAGSSVRSVLGERLEGGDEVAFESVAVDTDPVQWAVVLFGLEQGKSDVLGSDVVVPQPKRLPEGQFERLLRRPVEGDQG